MTPDTLELCRRALHWAQERNYTGYDKHDALNSPLLRRLTAKSRKLRAASVYAVSRSPVNLRPLLGVRKGQNPKGLSLFARTCFNLYTLTGERRYLDEGLRLLDVLLPLSQREAHAGHCWGYDHPWENLRFYIPAYDPNCVVTCFVGTAFRHAFKLTNDERYASVHRSAADFLLHDLQRIDVGPDLRCCSYDTRSNWKVINVNALAAAYLAGVYARTNEAPLAEAAQKMMHWVVKQQTRYHAWYYTDPPNASRITHDNYHTRFVLDALREYLNVIEGVASEQAWRRGMAYYQANLFTPDGAPKWMHDQPHPHDIHGAAQGIITFSRSAMDAERMAFAQRILEWTLANLYEPNTGRFYYQRGRLWTKRFTFMRWSQAWMCYALSALASAERAAEIAR